MKSASTILPSPGEFVGPEISWTKNLVLGGAGLVLVFAPLAYAAVHPWAYFTVGLTLEALSLTILAHWLYLLWGRPRVDVIVPYPPLWWLALGLWLIVLIQVVPWPREVVGWVSPAAVTIRALGNGYALADFISLSLNPYATILEGLKQWPAVLLFFVIIVATTTKRQINLLIYLILAIALFEVVYGVLTFHEHIIWGWKSPYNPQRLCGTFINPDHLATYLTMAILLGFGLFLGQRPKVAPFPDVVTGRRLLKRWSWSENTEPQFFRLLLVFLLVVLTTGLILTGSRGGMVALVIGFVLMAVLSWSKKRQKAHAYVIAIFVVIALGYSLFLGSNRALARFLHLDFSRYYFFQSAWDQFREFPLIGSGVASFPDLAYHYQAPELKGVRLLYAHNDWLQGLAETGIMGFALVTGGCLCFFVKLVRQWHSRHDVWARGLGLGGLAALVVAGFHALVDFSFHIPAVTLLYGSIAAITFLALYRHRRMWETFSYRTINLAHNRLVATGIILGLFILQLFFIWQVGVHWLAEAAAPTEINSTRTVFAAQPQNYLQALAYSPRNSRLYAGLAAVSTTAASGQTVNNPEESPGTDQGDLLKEAITWAPGFWEHHLQLAEFYLKHYSSAPGGYLPQALEEIDAAIQLFPSSGYLHLRMGIILWWAENRCLALVPLKFRGQYTEYLRKAIMLDKDLHKSALPYLLQESTGKSIQTNNR